jgi:hypothetical protein
MEIAVFFLSKQSIGLALKLAIAVKAAAVVVACQKLRVRPQISAADKTTI